MSAELNDDLVRLCTLLHMKNELQSQRHTARKKEQRYQTALSSKRFSQERTKLERVATEENNPRLLQLAKIEKHAKTLPGWVTFGCLDIERMKRAAQDEMNRAKERLCHVPQFPRLKLSKKLQKISNTELKMLQREQHIANETAKLNIAKFTKEFRKEIASIAKRNNWEVVTDNYNGFYTGIRRVLSKKEESLQSEYWSRFIIKDRDQLANIAASQFLETAMVAS